MRISLILLNGLLTTGFAIAHDEPDRRGISDYITAGLTGHQADYSVVLDAQPYNTQWVTPSAPIATGASVSEAVESTTTITILACPASYATSSSGSLSWETSWSSTATAAPVYGIPTTTSSTDYAATASSNAGPLTNNQQVGDSILGTLHQPTFPKWLDDADGKPYTSPPWDDRTTQNSDATIQGDVPNTNVTRHYDFTVSRSRLSPDGVLRDMITVNGQFPGPAIEANWGDWIVVTVHNNITAPDEGTAMHWHGMLQRGSQWEDGTPSISQCPIAPGQSYTYEFQAEIYGTSFYHAHYSAQYTAGIVGPMMIYGPWASDYDVDLGPVLLSDWNHIPYFSMVDDVVGTDLSKIPPLSDNGLINGRGQFDCSQPSYSNSSDWLASNLPSDLIWTCVDWAPRSEFRFLSGKIHRLRLMNTGADGVQKFSIDGHVMTVIATDYVPVTPYTTEVVTLGVGQRTDILVTADQDPSSSWWMRSELPGVDLCGGLGTPSGPGGSYPQVQATIYYEDADTSLESSSTSTMTDVSCDNQPLDVTQPEYAITPSADAYVQGVVLALTLNSTGSYNFLINDQTFHANLNEPLLYEASNPSYIYEPQWNVYNFGDNNSVILNVTNFTPFTHPFHLHGHTFYVLSTGESGAIWDGSVVNPTNPMRRDVQIVPGGGYAAIQYEADNPGVWPFHCHAAWHQSGGLGMNVVSKPDQIGDIPAGARQSTCDAWEAFTNSIVVDQIDSGS